MAKRSNKDRDAAGRFAYEGLERAIHEKARLGILTSLLTRTEGLPFTELKDLCTLTDGNLNRHLKVLVDAGLVEIWKGYRSGRPQTRCRLTPEGRQRFLDYVGVLERVVSDAVDLATDAPPAAGRLANGWSPA